MVVTSGNMCLFCDCYDDDRGCTMPSSDKQYACPLRNGSLDISNNNKSQDNKD